MFRHIDGRPAIFAAEGKALNAAGDDQQDRRNDPGLGIGGQEADGKGGSAHQHDGGQEGPLAPGLVADTTENQRAQRTHGETGTEDGQGKDKGQGVGNPGEKGLGQDLRQGAENEEVVPFKGGARR